MKYLSILISLVLITALSAQKKEIDKSFSGVNTIKINTSSGNLLVKKGSGSDVKVNLVYDEDDFEPQMEQSGKRLRLSEESDRGWGRGWRGSDRRSVWTITVPQNVSIEFSTASGDLDIADIKLSSLQFNSASGDAIINSVESDLDANTASGDLTISNHKGNIDANTASGDVKVTSYTGNLDANTASGDVKVRKGSGEFDVNTASGDIELTSINVSKASKMNAASGDVAIDFSSSPKADIEISTASGDATLDLNGNSLDAQVEMVARANRNRMRAPFDFDEEKTFRRWGKEYVRKMKKMGNGTYYMNIETASGSLTINK